MSNFVVCMDCKQRFNFNDNIKKHSCGEVYHSYCGSHCKCHQKGRWRCLTLKEHLIEQERTKVKQVNFSNPNILQLEKENQLLREQLSIKDNAIHILQHELVNKTNFPAVAATHLDEKGELRNNMTEHFTERGIPEFSRRMEANMELTLRAKLEHTFSMKFEQFDQQLERKLSQMIDLKLEENFGEQLNQISVMLSQVVDISTELNKDKLKLANVLLLNESAHLTPQPKKQRGKSKKVQDIPKNTGKSVINSNVEKTNESPNWYAKGVIIRYSVWQDTSLVGFVMKLVNIMEVPIKEVDIDKIFTLNENHESQNKPHTETSALVVVFSSPFIKSLFLSNKEKLKNNLQTRSLVLQDYISKDTMTIFDFAQNLQAVGYKHIFCKNNEVYVKKTETGDETKIYSSEHICDLLRVGFNQENNI